MNHHVFLYYIKPFLNVQWGGEHGVKALINGYLHHITAEMSVFNHRESSYTLSALCGCISMCIA